jgi:hypothetical protein
MYWNKKLYREHGLTETFWSGPAGVNADHKELPEVTTMKGPVTYRPTEGYETAFEDHPPVAMHVRTVLQYTNHMDQHVAAKRQTNVDPITGEMLSKRREMDFQALEAKVKKMRESNTIRLYLRELKAQRRIRSAEAGEDPDSPTSLNTEKAFAQLEKDELDDQARKAELAKEIHGSADSSRRASFAKE